MFPDLERIHRPETVEEALRLLVQGGRRPLAGGTALGIWRRSGIREVVDLWGLPLDLMEEDRRSHRIGATVTVERLTRAPADGVWDGALTETAGAVAATPVRNLITLGGSLCTPVPWSDLPVLLLALEAKVELARPEGPRSIPMAEWLGAPPAEHLGGISLLTGVELPRPRPGEGAAFETLTQVRFDYALTSAAASLGILDGTIQWARLAVGAVEPLPVAGVPQSRAAVRAELARTEPIRRMARQTARTLGTAMKTMTSIKPATVSRFKRMRRPATAVEPPILAVVLRAVSPRDTRIGQ